VRLFGGKFRGVFSVNSKFPIKSGYYVINTDVEKGRGIHWIGMVVKEKMVYFYDSFGRNPNDLVPLLAKRIKKRGVWFDSKDREQKDLEVICGHLTIAWLQVVDKYGIVAAKKI
jgi:hypothetical protein